MSLPPPLNPLTTKMMRNFLNCLLVKLAFKKQDVESTQLEYLNEYVAQKDLANI